MNIGSATTTATPFSGGPRTQEGAAKANTPPGPDRARAAEARTQQLSTEELQRVTQLKAIDAKVRAHEMAHVAAGFGVVTGGPTYNMAYGPDGRAYAVGGSVGVDTSAEKDPQANIEKGRRIQAAAMAPAEPSGQDFRVAAQGRALEAEGRKALAREQSEAAAELLQARQTDGPQTEAPDSAQDRPSNPSDAAGQRNPWRGQGADAAASPVANATPRLSVWA